jgi:hypothetical protein
MIELLIRGMQPEFCATLEHMARAVTKYVFAALLAVLSTQAVVPSVRVAPAIEIVCSTRAKQRIPQNTRNLAIARHTRPPVPAYISCARPEPSAPILIQRPPPPPSVFA